jgi:hypothetical protein
MVMTRFYVTPAYREDGAWHVVAVTGDAHGHVLDASVQVFDTKREAVAFVEFKRR